MGTWGLDLVCWALPTAPKLLPYPLCLWELPGLAWAPQGGAVLFLPGIPSLSSRVGREPLRSPNGFQVPTLKTGVGSDSAPVPLLSSPARPCLVAGEG